MITFRGLGADLPRNRLYRDMTEFYLHASGTSIKCRVGVYKADWRGSTDWHWWCPGCQNRQLLKGWHEFPRDIQNWGPTWEWAMNEAWKHVREVRELDRHDESVASHNYS